MSENGDKEEPVTVHEDSLAGRLAMSMGTEAGELTPRRRSARINRRLSATAGSSSPSSTCSSPARSTRGRAKKAPVTEPIPEEDKTESKVIVTNDEEGSSTDAEKMSGSDTEQKKDIQNRKKEAESINKPLNDIEEIAVEKSTSVEASNERQAEGETKTSGAAPRQGPPGELLTQAEAKENVLPENPQEGQKRKATADGAHENPASPPKKMLLEKYNEEQQCENVSAAVAELGNDKNMKKATGPKTKKKVDRKAAHEEAMSLGRKKSGRFWKASRDRFKSVVKSKEFKQDAKRRMEVKQEKLRVRQMEQALAEEKKREAAEKRARKEENQKKRLENERKNEVIQQIKNPAKIKRMKKKQLRMLAKRDVVDKLGATK